jgi:Ni/Fe-hydrogenase subunit HybB-like protein
MVETPTEKTTLRETLIFFAKLTVYLIALAAFGFVVYSLTKSLQIHR